MARLEAGVAQLQREFAELKPSIEHLVTIEDDLDELVAQLFTMAAPTAPTAGAPPAPAAPTAAAATVPPATPARTAPPNPAAPAPSATASAAPLSLLPSPRAPASAPPAQPQAPAPAPTAQPAPLPAPAAAPPATPPAATAANAFALHLASYRTREKLSEGWASVMGKVPSALQGLRGGAAPFDKPGDGRYFRLNAGPVATRADAETRCRAIQAAGLYCAVLPYAGTVPL